MEIVWRVVERSTNFPYYRDDSIRLNIPCNFYVSKEIPVEIFPREQLFRPLHPTLVVNERDPPPPPPFVHPFRRKLCTDTIIKDNE